jgi:aryl-alcohol dehydrogenase-like predicted oxidoreductase
MAPPEFILGAAIKGRRDDVPLSTKVSIRAGQAQRRRRIAPPLFRAVDRALERLGTDYIDLLQLHHFDAMTPVEQVMSALDDLVRSGRVLYVGASNFSGWQLMKALAASDRHGYARFANGYIAVGRDYDELMPPDRPGHRRVVWSPLGWGRLTGKLRRGQPLPDSSRLHETARSAPPVDEERLYRVIDALDQVAGETGKTVPQVAINWLLQRPTVSTVLIGARNEEQLRDNLGAVGWRLSAEQLGLLDAASEITPPYPYYPYWNGQLAERNPAPVAVRTLSLSTDPA